jgi:hypothetical protein
MEKAVIRFAGITRGGGYKHVDVYVAGVGRTGIGSRLVECVSLVGDTALADETRCSLTEDACQALLQIS